MKSLLQARECYKRIIRGVNYKYPEAYCLAGPMPHTWIGARYTHRWLGVVGGGWGCDTHRHGAPYPTIRSHPPADVEDGEATRAAGSIFDASTSKDKSVLFPQSEYCRQ